MGRGSLSGGSWDVSRSGEELDGALLGMAAAQCARLGDGKPVALCLGLVSVSCPFGA